MLTCIAHDALCVYRCWTPFRVRYWGIRPLSDSELWTPRPPFLPPSGLRGVTLVCHSAPERYTSSNSNRSDPTKVLVLALIMRWGSVLRHHRVQIARFPAGTPANVDSPPVNTHRPSPVLFQTLSVIAGKDVLEPLTTAGGGQTTPVTTSTSSIRQLVGATDAQTAHHATFSTAPTHQILDSANAEMTPARTPALLVLLLLLLRPKESSNPTQHAKGRTGDCPGPRKGTTTRRNVTQGGCPLPPGLKFHRGEKRNLQKEILIWVSFGTQTFGFQTPPPPAPLF